MTTRQQVWWEAWRVGRSEEWALAGRGQELPKEFSLAFADEVLAEFDKRWPEQKADEEVYFGLRRKPNRLTEHGVVYAPVDEP